MLLDKNELKSLGLLLRKYSSFTALQTSVAWLIRFVNYVAQRRPKDFHKGPLSQEERSRATLAVVKLVQGEAFSKVLRTLPNHSDFDAPVIMNTDKQLMAHACIRDFQDLDPYVVDGILRVGGRLRNSCLSISAKHPMLLPSNHHVTDLLILSRHCQEGHFGSLHTLNALNKEYWVLKGKTTVKKALKKCMNCRFWKAKEGKQKVASLPSHRVTPNPPFEATGTDLMGPVLVKIGRSLAKRYICIFNCLASRAVHLEVVELLKASSFIQAFRRFWNRRITRPKHMYSDNAGNFTAANREINEGLKIWHGTEFSDAMAKERIVWHFNPPLASHQGGFYETFFRLVRKIMQSVIQEATVSEFDLLTLVTEIERILNSRPITHLPDSPSELQALTPAMILSGSLEDDVVPGVFVRKDVYRRA